MVIAVQFQVVGLNQTLSQLKKIGEEKLNKINEAVHLAGFELVNKVQEDIATKQWTRIHPDKKGSYVGPSVDTGRFLNSIPVDSDMTQPLISVVQSNVPYAKHLEEGTTKIPKRQHFWRTLMENKDRIERSIKEAAK